MHCSLNISVYLNVFIISVDDLIINKAVLNASLLINCLIIRIVND